ncbi:MAG TPA: hypothetical protein P5533_09450, partial [Candidatus Cloacimonadota bacterium]|nr:hypothetical protein [Candidatus Cloacimonadota bacterium]
GTSALFSWSYTYPFLVDHANLWIMTETDSIMISQNVTTGSTSFTYYIPQTMDWQGCKFVVDLYAVDGLVTRYYSPYTFAMVPAMSFAYNEPGPKMRANPWSSSDLTVENVFGAGAIGYRWTSTNQWEQYPAYTYTDPVFVNSPDISFYSTVSPVTSTELSINLRQGWNFIPNPHLTTYDVEDIRFYLGANLFRMGEMIAQGLISRGIYIYRNGSYVLADSLPPYEALLIKYYGPLSLNPQINFYPFFSAPETDPVASDWQLGLKAMAAADDRDEILIGANRRSSNSYDFSYDLPKPPRSPFDRVYMMVSHAQDADSSYLDRLLHTDFRAGFSAGGDSIKTWDISIYAPSNDPIAMEFVPQGIPENWTVSLHM